MVGRAKEKKKKKEKMKLMMEENYSALLRNTIKGGGKKTKVPDRISGMQWLQGIAMRDFT